MTEVLCVCTFCCGAIHVHIYFTSVSAGMLACMYGVACRLAWCQCYACRCMLTLTCRHEEPTHKEGMKY
jgi:hypothetical protein